MRLFFFLLVTVPFTIFAQNDFRPGFIVNNIGEKKTGLIEYRGEYVLYSECYFKANKTDTANIYSPNKISSYGFDDGRLFVTKKIILDEGEMNVFLEYLLDGELDVYKYKYKNTDQYFIDKKGEGLRRLPYIEDNVYINGKSYKKRSNYHIGLLKLYLKETPDLYKKIEKIQKPNDNNLVNLAEEYHDLTCETGECINYTKVKSFQIIPELNAGIINLNTSDTLNNKNSQFGFQIHFNLPSINDKLYFKTGISYYKKNYYAGQTDHYGYYKYLKFPIQFEYRYPRGMVRPHFAYGISLYNRALSTVTMSGGINFNRTEFSAGFNIDSDFSNKTFIILPGMFYGITITIGISYNFNIRKK